MEVIIVVEPEGLQHCGRKIVEVRAMRYREPPPASWLADSPAASDPLGTTVSIARVTLEIALRREFDYLIPEELRDQVEVGTRVKVPFGPRQVLGCVTALVEHSPHDRLRPILRVISRPALITARVLELARWIADYYCCPLEIALRSVLPEAVRREEDGWRRQLTVWALPQHGELPVLTPRQRQIWTLIEEWRELPLRELQALAETTAATIRKLEDKGLIRIGPWIFERDLYVRE
jgi:primosomal protein N' (replication factor Y) (superfamily II helicase)